MMWGIAGRFARVGGDLGCMECGQIIDICGEEPSKLATRLALGESLLKGIRSFNRAVGQGGDGGMAAKGDVDL